jgi:hypothetical protein
MGLGLAEFPVAYEAEGAGYGGGLEGRGEIGGEGWGYGGGVAEPELGRLGLGWLSGCGLGRDGGRDGRGGEEGEGEDEGELHGWTSSILTT